MNRQGATYADLLDEIALLERELAEARGSIATLRKLNGIQAQIESVANDLGVDLAQRMKTAIALEDAVMAMNIENLKFALTYAAYALGRPQVEAALAAIAASSRAREERAKAERHRDDCTCWMCQPGLHPVNDPNPDEAPEEP